MIQKLFVGLAITLLFACNNNNNTPAVDYEKLYLHSMEVKDYQTAIVAAQAILQADSAKQPYLDTLPELYASVRNYAATEVYTDKVLSRRPNEEKFLQLKALCLQEAGKGMELLDFYNKLFVSTGKITYLYQVATIQVAAGDMKGAEASVKSLEEKMLNNKDSVDFMLSETEKQLVPLRAAVYNVKAYMSAQNKDLMGAKKNFELALKEFPDFIAAQQNYMRLVQGGRQ
jgi:tetratricopeptide (TPR) repeat protein